MQLGKKFILSLADVVKNQITTGALGHTNADCLKHRPQDRDLQEETTGNIPNSWPTVKETKEIEVTTKEPIQ